MALNSVLANPLLQKLIASMLFKNMAVVTNINNDVFTILIAFRMS